MSKDLKIGINPILNLNKHPRECENLSLINANNVKLSNDLSCLESENSIIQNQVINDYLMRLYSRYNIISTIPCNKELILFVGKASETTAVISEGYDITIVRYNEDENKCIKYTDYKYYGGKINGTFTYNVNGELMLAITEYDGIKKVPLKTINLGLFEDKDVKINNKLLPLCPEVTIPRIKEYDYVDGNLYKGWYYIYLRYKINENDYTKWFSISNKILVNTIDRFNIIKYYETKGGTDNRDFYLSGASDYFSNETEISNESIKITLDNLDIVYKKYQLGLIIISNTYNKCYVTDDLNINNKIHIFDLSLMYEYPNEEIIKSSLNLFDVKNVINYKNKLYVSNYNEQNIKDYDTSGINIKLSGTRLTFTDLKQVNYIKNVDAKNSYELESNAAIKTSTSSEPDTIEAKILKDLNVDGIKPNADLIVDIDFSEPRPDGKAYGIKLHDSDYSITESIDGGKITKLVTLDLYRQFTIQSTNGQLVNIVCKANKFLPYDMTSFNLTYELQFGITFEIEVDNTIYVSRAGCVFTTKNYRDNELYFIGLSDDINSNVLTQKIQLNQALLYNINTKESYNRRRKNTTLIPGEIYNFYIHFVDKYGQVTQGYQIQNNNKLFYADPDYVDNTTFEAVLIPIFGFDDYVYEDHCYLIRKYNDNVFDNSGTINIFSNESIYYCFKEDIVIDEHDLSIRNINRILEFDESDKEELIFFIINKYKNLDCIKNLKWYQLPDATIGDEFLSYENKNKQRLFKVPHYTLDTSVDVFNNYGITFTIIEPDISTIQVSKDYEACFISYERFQETAKVTGLLTKYDTILSESETHTEYNKIKSSYMRFYSSDFDLLSKVDLKYNALIIEKINSHKENLNINVLNNTKTDYVSNLNVPQLEGEPIFKCIGLSDYEIELADDYVKNRYGAGTCLKIPILNELFEGEENTIYKASLLYIDENIYSNDDKVLIKCSDVIYKDSINTSFNFTLNGFFTYNNFLIYNNNKVIFDEVDRIIKDENSNNYKDIIKYLTYIQTPVYKTFMYETKCFNNNPKNIIYDLSKTKDEKVVTEGGCFVTPANSRDLFKMKYDLSEELTPKYYINYKPDLYHLNEFNKFIRRSKMIKDESLENSWRIFEAEDYKIISENKGNITNILGLGIYLIVHTEHSIFIFSSDNTLKNGDATIQLENSDIFDLYYKELISSELGYGGLQDSDSWISGVYGYIYYDKDSNRLFRFDNNSLVNIDDNIINLLTDYKPKKIIFADDKESNRLLLNITFDDTNKENNITLSYNYITNSFISFHDYKFIDSINTKNKLYLIGKIDNYNSKIYNFDYYNKNNITHNSFSITDGKLHNNQLDIIINDTYDIVKFLENITYKLFKIKQNKENYNPTIINKSKIPYSGEKIRIYNDKVDTGWLDIKIQEGSEINPFMQYDKPYWYLGNWNFNYLRDKISIRDEANYMSKLYGNYFIVSIVFADSNDKIEFNSLMYNLTK